MTLFNRLGVEFTYAKSDTSNQILNVPTPASLGFSSKWQNAGTLPTRRFELALNLPVISKKDLQWNMRGTLDRNRAVHHRAVHAGVLHARPERARARARCS